jgi:hypothetical protein
MSTIGDLIFELIGIWARDHEFYSKHGTIKDIDLNERTCTVTPVDGGPDILDVYLEGDAGSEESKGFFVVPAVGSLVIVTWTSKEEAFLSAYTNIDQVVAKQGEWIFNDGSNGGLTKLKELTDRLNEYEELFSQLKSDFNSWVPVPNDGGAALKTVLSSGYLTKQVPDSDRGDFENELVKH